MTASVVERMTAAQFRESPPKKKQRELERDVMVLVRDYLRLHGWLVFRHQQSLGSLKGFPDLTALKDGLTIYIECKAPKGKLHEAQRNFRYDCERHGGRYLVVRGLEDLEGL